MKDDKYKNYLNDVLFELINRYKKKKSEYDNENNEFNSGLLLGYYETISFLLNQADVFEISPSIKKEIMDFEPDKLL